MDKYTINDTKDHLRQFIEDAQLGKKLLILDDHNRPFQLGPVVTLSAARKAGSTDQDDSRF